MIGFNITEEEVNEIVETASTSGDPQEILKLKEDMLNLLAEAQNCEREYENEVDLHNLDLTRIAVELNIESKGLENDNLVSDILENIRKRTKGAIYLAITASISTIGFVITLLSTLL